MWTDIMKPCLQLQGLHAMTMPFCLSVCLSVHLFVIRNVPNTLLGTRNNRLEFSMHQDTYSGLLQII